MKLNVTHKLSHILDLLPPLAQCHAVTNCRCMSPPSSHQRNLRPSEDKVSTEEIMSATDECSVEEVTVSVT